MNVSDSNVEMGTKATTKVVGRGSITLKLQCGSSFELRKLENVLHIPSFEYSLLSVSALDKKGMDTTFGNGQCVIRKGSLTVATGTLEGSLYVIHTRRLHPCKQSALVASLQLWHERMAHVDKQGITQMADRGVVRGLRMIDNGKNLVCEGCVKGKVHRSPIPKTRTSPRASDLLDKVHSDVCGPVEVPSLGGSRYFVTFIDEHSNWVTVFLLKRKSEVAVRFLEYEKLAERQTGRKRRVLRSDRGGEYLSDMLSSYFKHQGIVHELTAADTPHQNGVAERFNRTSLKLVRSMLNHMSVPKRFWAEALSTAVYIRNRVTSRALPSNKTAHHFWKKDTPTVAHLRVFGCKCWYTLPKAKVKKLDARGKPAIFVGYAETSKAYKLIDVETGKVVVSRDVIFDETAVADYSSIGEATQLNISYVKEDGENERQVNLDIEREQVAVTNPTSAEIRGEATEGAEDNTDQGKNSPCLGGDTEMTEAMPDVHDEPDQPDSCDGHVLNSGRVSKPPGSWSRACLLYTSPSPRDLSTSRMPSSA